MKTAVAFYRVSTRKQQDDRQKADIKKYCKAYNIKIVEEITETISGATKLQDRSKLQLLLQYIEDNRPDICIVSELSRLGRTFDVLTILKRLNELKVCFISLKEGLRTLNEDKTPNAVAVLLISVLTGINEFELSTISYRINSGRNNAVVNRGSWTGGKIVPYGYCVQDKRLVVDEKKEAAIVKLIFEHYNEGWGGVRIANYLNNKNVLTRSAKNAIDDNKKVSSLWSRSSVHNIIRNPIYTGKRRHYPEGRNDPKSKNYRKDFKPVVELLDFPELRIIDDITFNTANARLSESKNRNLDFNLLKKYDYQFDKQIIKCSCGKHYIGIHRENHYKCVSQKTSRGCGNPKVQIDYIETAIQYHIAINWFQLIEDNTAIIKESEIARIQLKEFENEIKKQKQKQDTFIEAYAENRLTRTNYDKKYNDSQIIIDKAEKQIKNLQDKIGLGKKTLKKLIYYKQELTLNNEGNYEVSAAHIDKQTLHAIIKQILITDRIEVELINGHRFYLPLKPEKIV